MVWVGGTTSLFCMWISTCLVAICWKDYTYFLIEWLWPSCWKLVDHKTFPTLVVLRLSWFTLGVYTFIWILGSVCYLLQKREMAFYWGLHWPVNQFGGFCYFSNSNKSSNPEHEVFFYLFRSSLISSTILLSEYVLHFVKFILQVFFKLFSVIIVIAFLISLNLALQPGWTCFC